MDMGSETPPLAFVTTLGISKAIEAIVVPSRLSRTVPATFEALEYEQPNDACKNTRLPSVEIETVWTVVVPALSAAEVDVADTGIVAVFAASWLVPIAPVVSCAAVATSASWL